MFGGDEINGIVVDLGSHTVKAGFAGEDQPKSVFPSAFGVRESDGDMAMDGVPRKAGAPLRKGTRDLYVGNIAVNYPRPGMEVSQIFDPATGLYSDWDGVEAVYDHLFYQALDVDPKDRPLLLCEPSCNTDEARERLVQLMFEKYHAPAVFLGKDAVMATFSSARSTALVVDVGHGQTCLSAVLDGFLLKGSVTRVPLAGQLLTDLVGGAISAKGMQVRSRHEVKRVPDGSGGFAVQELSTDALTPSFRRFQASQVVTDVREVLCSRVSELAILRAEDALSVPAASYELPDGQEVKLQGERVMVPEVLLNPDWAKEIPGGQEVKFWGGEACQGLPECVKSAIHKVDVDHSKDLYGNIVLVGGCSSITGLRDRLEMAVTERAPISTHQGTMRVRVVMPTAGPERRFANWIGGSILSSLGTFQQMWMSRVEYQESGAALIHKRAP